MCNALVTPSCLLRRLISKCPGKREARDEYVTQSRVPEVDRDAMYVRSNKNDKKQGKLVFHPGSFNSGCLTARALLFPLAHHRGIISSY